MKRSILLAIVLWVVLAGFADGQYQSGTDSFVSTSFFLTIAEDPNDPNTPDSEILIPEQLFLVSADPNDPNDPNSPDDSGE